MSLQNLRAISAIYAFELHRFRRTLLTGPRSAPMR